MRLALVFMRSKFHVQKKTAFFSVSRIKPITSTSFTPKYKTEVETGPEKERTNETQLSGCSDILECPINFVSGGPKEWKNLTFLSRLNFCRSFFTRNRLRAVNGGKAYDVLCIKKNINKHNSVENQTGRRNSLQAYRAVRGESEGMSASLTAWTRKARRTPGALR